MRAALLREIIKLQRYQSVQSDSGEVSKELVTYLTLRAYKQSSNGSYRTQENEMFDTMTVVFQFRYVDDLVESDLLEWNSQKFKIVFIDHNVYDNTMKITCQKINE